MTLSVDIKYKSNGQIASLKSQFLCLFPRFPFTSSLVYVTLYHHSTFMPPCFHLAFILVACA